MKPILFTIGEFSLRSYTFISIVAVLTVVLLLVFKEIPASNIKEEYRKNLTERVWEAVILGIFLAAVGGRLFFVFSNWELVAGKPWWFIFAFWRGGLVFYGGFFAVVIGLAVYCYLHRIPFWEPLDYVIPYAVLGYAIGRIGCFLNGCCYGHVTDLPWGMVYPALDEYARHPTQLYSSASALLIFFILRFLLMRHKYFHGYIFSWFLVLYGIYRFSLEFFRVDGPAAWFFSQAQIIAVVFIGAGIFTLAWKKKGGER